MQKHKTDHSGPTGHKLPWSVLIWLAIFLMPIACQTQHFKSNHVNTSKIATPTGLRAGDFLAARQATYFKDVEASANFYLAALQPDDRNAELLRSTFCLLYTSPSPRDPKTSRMPSSA